MLKYMYTVHVAQSLCHTLHSHGYCNQHLLGEGLYYTYFNIYYPYIRESVLILWNNSHTPIALTIQITKLKVCQYQLRTNSPDLMLTRVTLYTVICECSKAYIFTNLKRMGEHEDVPSLENWNWIRPLYV